MRFNCRTPLKLLVSKTGNVNEMPNTTLNPLRPLLQTVRVTLCRESLHVVSESAYNKPPVRISVIDGREFLVAKTTGDISHHPCYDWSAFPCLPSTLKHLNPTWKVKGS